VERRAVRSRRESREAQKKKKKNIEREARSVADKREILRLRKGEETGDGE